MSWLPISECPSALRNALLLVPDGIDGERMVLGVRYQNGGPWRISIDGRRVEGATRFCEVQAPETP